MLITNKRLLLPSLFEDTMSAPPATFPLAGWDLYSNKDINTATSHWRRPEGGYQAAMRFKDTKPVVQAIIH